MSLILVAEPLEASPALEFEAVLALPVSSSRASRPVAVTVGGRDAEICVTDASAAGGLLFNRRGVFTFATGRLAGFADPQDLVLEETGGFVCTDSGPGGTRTIRRLSFYGEPLPYTPAAPIDGWQPHHLLVTRDGHYLTIDQQNGLVAKHDRGTGALLWSKELRRRDGTEILGLGRPAEDPDGRLYVPLGNERRVLVLSENGETESGFGTPGTGRGRFAFPVGAAWCASGSVAVLDRMRGTILLFTPGGRFEGEFGRLGAGPGNLYQPVSIASSPDGRIYVAQGFESRVQVFQLVESTSYDTSGNAHRRAMAAVGGAGSEEGRDISARFSTVSGSSDLSGNDMSSERHWIQTELTQ